VRFRPACLVDILLFCDRVSITLSEICRANDSVHSATLGKGKADDTIRKVKNGDLKGKGEVVMVFGKQASSPRAHGVFKLTK
jgi:hypothetical protein